MKLKCWSCGKPGAYVKTCIPDIFLCERCKHLIERKKIKPKTPKTFLAFRKREKEYGRKLKANFRPVVMRVTQLGRTILSEEEDSFGSSVINRPFKLDPDGRIAK